MKVLWLVVTIATCVATAGYAQSNSSETGRDTDVRALIDQFAGARNSHDGKAASETYTENGEYYWVGGTRMTLWGNVQGGDAHRTIKSVEFVTPGVAMVRVVAEFSAAAPLIETYIVVMDGSHGEFEFMWPLYTRQSEVLEQRLVRKKSWVDSGSGSFPNE